MFKVRQMSNLKNRYQREKDRTREALIHAALALVLEKGYRDVSVTAIADRADYGRGTFYLYFEDKADVVWAGLGRYMDDWHTNAFEDIKEIQSLRREYLSWVAVFTNLQDYWHFYAQIDLEHGSAVWAKLRQYLIQTYEDNLRAGKYRSHIDMPIPMMARFLYGALQETMLWWVETGFACSAEELATMVFQMVYRQPVPEE